jgi:uncharacterized Zn finger protein
MSRWEYDRYFERSTPIRSDAGIRAKAGRKLGGERWWAKRWIAVLEGFSMGGRLTRGRSYARSGQVLSIDIAPGVVTARVQGSRPKPYTVTIKLAPLAPDMWARVIAEIAGRAIYLAKLLAGEMPAEIEEVFQAARTPLFPSRSRDLITDCSCPDFANPCKHVAAVYYLMGEEFDRDPFLIFTLRGLPRESLMEQLHSTGASDPAVAHAEEVVRESLAIDPVAFWSGAPISSDFVMDVRHPAVTAGLLRRLGDFPFWHGTQRLDESLTPTYTEGTERARDLYQRLCGESDATAQSRGT